MTVRAFWPNTYITVTTPLYRVTYPNGVSRVIGRKTAAEWFFDPEFPYNFKLTKTFATATVKACPWCGVRPEVYEMDCDGPAGTGTCGSPQCNQLKRCEGCGRDGKARYGSVRGHLCGGCHTVATRDNLVAADDRYALIPWAEYYGQDA